MAEVSTTWNGTAAMIELRKKDAPSLAIVDWMMPEMDGLEATRGIRGFEQATGRHTPIAAMTAHVMTGDRERCLAAGMDYYISKPLQKTELLALLGRIAGGRRAVGAATAPAPSHEDRAPLLAQQLEVASTA